MIDKNQGVNIRQIWMSGPGVRDLPFASVAAGAATWAGWLGKLQRSRLGLAGSWPACLGNVSVSQVSDFVFFFFLLTIQYYTYTTYIYYVVLLDRMVCRVDAPLSRVGIGSRSCWANHHIPSHCVLAFAVAHAGPHIISRP